MSLERPWEKAFSKLIESLKTSWGESLPPRRTSDPGRDRPSIGSSWTYPAVAWHRGENRVVVSISESPVGCGGLLDAMDNYEFLHISLIRKLNALLILRHEGIFDRLKKAIKFEWEYQTGNREFDRKYYIVEARSESDKRLVCSGEFQGLIEQLEPIASVALLESGIHCSLAIDDESVLSSERVENVLDRMDRIAGLAPQ